MSLRKLTPKAIARGHSYSPRRRSTWPLVAFFIMLAAAGFRYAERAQAQRVAGPHAYYANCAAARAAGVAPIYEWEVGYRAPLDGDQDGIACEWSK